jgi:hypothetical protein
MRRAGWQAAVAVCWTRTAAAFKTEKRLKKYAAVNGQSDTSTVGICKREVTVPECDRERTATGSLEAEKIWL